VNETKTLNFRGSEGSTSASAAKPAPSQCRLKESGKSLCSTEFLAISQRSVMERPHVARATVYSSISGWVVKWKRRGSSCVCVCERERE
jgi:hypothetical protein